MRLPKQTRTKLHEASKPIWIEWPPTGPFPRSGQSYRISLKGGSGFQILLSGVRVEKVPITRPEANFEVLAEKHYDAPATLWGLKGTRNSSGDYESEPEPIHDEYQSYISDLGWLKTKALGDRGRSTSRQVNLEAELRVARERGRLGRTRVLEAKLRQHAKKASQLAA